PVADDRLREPERALTLQRHRDEPRRPRRANRTRRPNTALGRAPRTTGRGSPGRAGCGFRPILEAGRRGTAAPPRAGGSADPSPAAASARLATLIRPARPTKRPAR